MSTPELRARAYLLADLGTTSEAGTDLVERRGYQLRNSLLPGTSHFIPAVGNNRLRQQFAEQAESARLVPYQLISPLSAVPTETADVAVGLVCFAGSYVSTNVIIGRHCHLNQGCRLSHDVRLGDFVTLSPGVLLAGACEIESHVFMGVGSVVLPGIRVGVGAI